MRRILMFKPLAASPPLPLFISCLDTKQRRRVLSQIKCLGDLHLSITPNPIAKRFTIEKYKQFYELQVKGKGLIRIIYTDFGEDILLLAPYVKRRPRDSMQALEQSLKMLSQIQETPDCAAAFHL